MIATTYSLLISKTIGVSILILIILAIRPLILRYLNAKIAYTLWLMIPIFLMLPVNWFLVFDSAPSPSMTFLYGIRQFVSDNLMLVDNSASGIVQLVIGLWLSGLLVRLFVYWRQYQQLINSFEASDYQLLKSVYNEILFDNKAFKSITIVNSSLVKVPAVFGLVNPYLILPKKFSSYPVQKQSVILKHELFHIKRKDHQINVIKVLVKSIFWFNPLFHFSDRYFEADQELSCDFSVLNQLSKSEKKHYATAILDVVSVGNQNCLVSQWQYPSLIKERVNMLKNTNQKSWYGWATLIFSSMVLLMTSYVSYAKEESKEAVPAKIVQPMYPLNAAIKSLEGSVRFRFNIDKTGKPYDISVVSSTPGDMFVKNAQKALEQWHFKIKEVDGQRVKQIGMLYTMEFRLK